MPDKSKAVKKQDLYLFHMRDDCQYLLQTTAKLTYEDFAGPMLLAGTEVLIQETADTSPEGKQE